MNQVSSAFSRRSKNLLKKPAKNNTYNIDVGLISFATFGRYRASVVFRHRPDIESISARCRRDIVDTSGRHRANVQTWSRPDISRHLPISARYNFPTSGRYRGRHFPISGRRRTAMVFRHRVYIGLISLTTSGRHRAHVQTTWSRPDISHQPTFADVGPI